MDLTLIVALSCLCLHLSSAVDISQVADSSHEVRQGRFVDVKKARKLGMLKFLGGLLVNSAGKGSFAASNTYNLFGKTVNSALSLSYGSTGSVPLLPGLPEGGGTPPVVAGVPGAAAGPPGIAVRSPQEDTVVVSSSSGLLPTSPEPQDTNDLRKPMVSNDGIRDQKFSGGPLPEVGARTTQASLRQNIVVDYDGALKLLESEQFNRFIAQHNANVEVLNNRRQVVT